MAETANGMEKVESGIMQVVDLGIYISVPFCRTKCSYCNFASDVFSQAAFGRYVDRVCSDIRNSEQTVREMGGQIVPDVDSIYLGGGTPTVLGPAQLEQIFAALRSQFNLRPEAEVSVECAPGTLTPAMLETLVRCGVNRVSLGVQSFVDAEAAAVGRLHKRATVVEDIARLRESGITNINIDLIAGLPHQTAASWEFSLAQAIATDVPHLSVYMLEVDDDSRLGRELLAGGTRYHAHFVPDEDVMADFYQAACRRLDESGIAQYEISNFARSGFTSRHNLKYWTRKPYLGFGVDAHSMLRVNGKPDRSACNKAADAVRFATADTLEQFVAGTGLQRTIVCRRAALEENLFLGLRLVSGVDLAELSAEFGAETVANFASAIQMSVEEDLVRQDGDRISLTPRGRLLSNEVFQRFLSPDDFVRASRPVAVAR
jgi:oxygen-independent coproporphyrinogen-3 oxidase